MLVWLILRCSRIITLFRVLSKVFTIAQIKCSSQRMCVQVSIYKILLRMYFLFINEYFQKCGENSEEFMNRSSTGTFTCPKKEGSSEKSKHIKMCYDIIYDERQRYRAGAAMNCSQESRRSRSISYDAFHSISSDFDDLDVKETEISPLYNKENINRSTNTLHSSTSRHSNSNVSFSNIYSTLPHSGKYSQKHQQVFSYSSSLKRPSKTEGSKDSVTLITTGNKSVNNMSLSQSKLTNVRNSPPTHTQLVNCKGKDEILLASDNLSSSTKFQNCTRRRDESFV